MRVVSLGSGSSGNSLLVEAGPQGRTRLLIDAGLSARTITSRLQSVGVSPSQLQGVLVTHEHSDHVQGIPTLSKRFGVPIVADPRTLIAIEEGLISGVWRSDSGKLVPTKVRNEVETQVVLSSSTTLSIEAGDVIETTSMTKTVATRSSLVALEMPIGTRQSIGDIEVTSFAVSHDAVAPCGYLLSTGACRICIVTDSGEVTPTMLEAMQHADLLILEANHDRERLLRGPYPWMLKRRILSPTGHLSNEQAAEAILRTWRDGGRRWLWLAHLSRTNNTPELALESIRAYLQTARANLAHIHMWALPHTMGDVWDSTLLWG